MTEAEWLVCTDPQKMLEFVRGKVSDRKLRLFAYHAYYQLEPHGSSDESFAAADFAAAYADGDISLQELTAAREYGRDHLDDYGFTADAIVSAFWSLMAPDTSEVQRTTRYVLEALYYMGCTEVELMAARANFCQMLRELVGDPFAAPRVSAFSFNEDVLGLARTAYEQGALAGVLDKHRLAVLADALEEAGDTDADMIDHLRKPGQHARGCWVVDLLLGKE